MRKIIFPPAILVLLVAVYLVLSTEEPQETPEPEEETASVQLINRSAEELERLDIMVPGVPGDERLTPHMMSFIQQDGLWLEFFHHDIPLNQHVLSDIASSLYSLMAVPFLKAPENLDEFGFGNFDYITDAAHHIGYTNIISVMGYFTNPDSELGFDVQSFSLGAFTPDRTQVYLLMDDNLYLVPAIVREQIPMLLEQLVEAHVPIINPRTLEFLYLHEHGREPLQFSWHGTPQEKEELLERAGMLYLRMDTPFFGRMLFFEALEMEAMDGFHELQIREAFDLAPENLRRYGLDEPSLVIIMRDSRETLHLVIGGDHDDETVYVQLGDMPYVFLMERHYIEGFFDLNPFTFIERFLAIPNIADVSGISISAVGSDYHMTLEHEEDESFTANVNGRQVEESDFRDFYVRLVSLQLEQELDISRVVDVLDVVYEPLAYAITYYFTDGSPPVSVELFEFDANFYFYVLERGRYFAVSRLGVNAMLEGLAALF